MRSARSAYLQKKVVALWFQKMHRGKTGRARFIALYNFRQEEMVLQEKQFQAAVTLQCLFRTNKAVATVATARKTKEASNASFYGDSEAVKLLKKQRQAAALQADKNAAIAKQTARERNMEVDDLRQKLQRAEITSEQQKTTREQLMILQGENDDLKDALANAMAEIAELKEQLANKNAEVKKLKESKGVIGPGSTYVSVNYDEHQDLKSLDERVNSLALNAQHEKKELESLILSLAILM